MRTFFFFLILCVTADARAVEWISHRGQTAGLVENSVAAVRSSWEIGSNAVELDVRVSKDGIVYLFHDDGIRGVSVSNLTYTEIRLITKASETPTLVSVLELGEPAGFYVLDIKDPVPGRYERIIEVVSESRIPQHKFVFQSDDTAVLSAIQRRLPVSRYFYLDRLKRKILFFLPPGPEDIFDQLADYEFDGVSIKGRRFLDEAFVDTLKNRGLDVYVWTINNPNRARHYISIGVDGIITDDVQGIRSQTK